MMTPQVSARPPGRPSIAGTIRHNKPTEYAKKTPSAPISSRRCPSGRATGGDMISMVGAGAVDALPGVGPCWRRSRPSL